MKLMPMIASVILGPAAGSACAGSIGGLASGEPAGVDQKT